MASRFPIVSKDELLAVNEAAAPTNTKKETKFGLLRFGRWKKISVLNLQQNHKIDLRNTVNCNVKKL